MIATSHRTRSTDGIDGKDSVGLYLDGIAKTPLLTAEEEVKLAREIEAGLYAESILSGTVTGKDRGGRKAVKATDTELSTVGKKNRARRNTEIRLLRSRATARARESTVCPMTTTSMNLRELPKALRKTESLVARFW